MYFSPCLSFAADAAYVLRDAADSEAGFDARRMPPPRAMISPCRRRDGAELIRF